MSDQTIDQLRASLKHLNIRMEKLSRAVNRLDFLAYQYKGLAMAYKQLAAQCHDISETMDQIDAAVFQVQQDYTFLTEAHRRVTSLWL